MYKVKDLSGQLFGNWLVLERAEKRGASKSSFWLCECQCNKKIKKIVSSSSLRRGDSKSCGCIIEEFNKSKVQDLTGKVFGRWTVISFDHKEEGVKQNKYYWKCCCDCDKKTEKILTSGNLTSGGSKSCGCLLKEVARNRSKIPEGEATFKIVFKGYKRRAEKKGIEFNLTKEEFIGIITNDCFYCGNSLDRKSKSLYSNGDFIYTGIDRIDSDKGYMLNNCVPCCIQCNKAKLNYSKEFFYQWVIKIYDHLKSKNEI